MKLAENLDFSKESFLEMLLLPTETKTSIERFEEIKTVIMEKHNPTLLKYLNDLNLTVELGKINTEDEVMDYKVEFLTPQFKREVAEEFDSFDKLDYAQKFFLFEVIMSAYLESANNFVQPIYRKRLQELVNAKFKKKIILP